MTEQSITFEIKSKDNNGKALGHVLYTPIRTAASAGVEFSFTTANLYHIKFTGEEKAVQDFAKTVLLDEVTQIVSSAVSSHDLTIPKGTLFYLEYQMHPDALDLEQQAILNYYKGAEQTFELNSLQLSFLSL